MLYETITMIKVIIIIIIIIMIIIIIIITIICLFFHISTTRTVDNSLFRLGLCIVRLGVR
jgi:amino acid transporter